MPQLRFTDKISCTLIDAHASDLSVVNAARVSFDQHHHSMETGDDKLIDYLLRERHGSPFEHSFFKFCVEAPIYVVREHMRHRIGHSVNEWSGRYAELEPNFYVPPNARVRVGKPGHYTYEEKSLLSRESATLDAEVLKAYKQSWSSYRAMIDAGVALEQARMVLPVGIMSKFIWSCNARSLMHYIGLRAAPNAQYEIQLVAHQAEAALSEYMPITYASYVVNGRVAP